MRVHDSLANALRVWLLSKSLLAALINSFKTLLQTYYKLFITLYYDQPDVCLDLRSRRLRLLLTADALVNGIWFSVLLELLS